MVVEVSTHNHSRVLVLSQDVLDDLRDSLCSLKLVSLLTPFKVAGDQVDPSCPISELDLCPVEVRSKSFDQLHSGDFLSIHKGNAAPFRT